MKGQLYFDLREIILFLSHGYEYVSRALGFLFACDCDYLPSTLSDVVKVKRESDRTLSTGEAGRPLLTLRLGADCQL